MKTLALILALCSCAKAEERCFSTNVRMEAATQFTADRELFSLSLFAMNIQWPGAKYVRLSKIKIQHFGTDMGFVSAARIGIQRSGTNTQSSVDAYVRVQDEPQAIVLNNPAPFNLLDFVNSDGDVIVIFAFAGKSMLADTWTAKLDFCVSNVKVRRRP